jgi:hypothetical protein
MGIGNFFKKFKKENIVIDLSDMQKRGLLKQKENLTVPVSDSSSGVVDLTENKSSEGSSPSALGFLGALAGASNSGSEVSETTSTESEPVSFASERKQKLKGILRDMKSEMKNANDKIYKLSDKLDLIERKMERLERRAGYD